jgi:hypothetical protein
LFNTSLESTIPSQLGRLVALNSLCVAHCSAVAFARLTSLLLFFFFSALNDNRLTGTIPSEFSSLKVLKALQIQNNRLIGSVPSLTSTIFGTSCKLQLTGNEGNCLDCANVVRTCECVASSCNPNRTFESTISVSTAISNRGTQQTTVALATVAMTSSNASLPISSLGAPVVDPDAVYVWIGIIGIILLVIVIVAVVVICSVRRCRQKSEVQQKPAAEMASTSGRELPHNYDRLPSALDANSGVVHGEYAEMTSARDGANASPSQPKIGTDYVTF